MAVFVSRFLPYSQTFVHDQLTNHQRYSPAVFAAQRTTGIGSSFTPVHTSGWIGWLAGRSRRFRTAFGDSAFDLVHAHFGTVALFALPWARRLRLPLIVTFHGYDVPLVVTRARYAPRYWPFIPRMTRLLREMRLGLCASQDLFDQLIAGGAPPERLTVHRLGIDLARFEPAEKEAESFQVIMIGRLVEKKGFIYGLRAFGRVAAARNDARLVIVGDGPEEPRLRAEVDRLGVDARVSFLGARPHREVRELLSCSHALLAPSVVGRRGDRDSGLMVVKEASASRCVPIGTLHGGIPEVIDDERSGFLVPERDVDALSERLNSLAADPERRDTLADAAREKMEREYDVRERVRELERLYDVAREG